MKGLVLITISTLSLFTITLAEPACHMSEVGVCFDHIANYINSLPKRNIPNSNDDLDTMCKAIISFSDCWDDFKKRCMTPIQNELEALILEGARDLRDRFCSPGSELSATYLKHSGCLNEVVGSDESTALIDRITLLFEKFDNIPDTRKLVYACCGWNTMYNNVRDAAMSKCGEEGTKSAFDLLSIAISNLPNVICAGFEENSDQCKKILPPEGSKPTGRHNPFVDGLRYFFKNHLD